MGERLIPKLDRIGAEAGIKQMTPEIYRFAWLLNEDKLKQWEEWKNTPTFGPQPNMQHGLNPDDWKDIVAAISKVRDGRGIYLGCRPADVFRDWFLAMGLFKEKANDT